MSVVFVVGSEDTLSSGMPWCKRLAEHLSNSIQVAVIGLDRKVLLELAKRSVKQALPDHDVSIQAVDNDPDAVLEFVRSVGGKTLLVLHCPDGDDFEKRLFEKSPIRTIWLKAVGDPPRDPKLVSIATHANSVLATSVSQRLFDVVPDGVLCGPDSDGLERDELIAHLNDLILGREEGRLLLFGIDETSKSNAAYKAAQRLVEESGPMSIALVRGGDSLPDSFGAKIRSWFTRVAPPLDREERLVLAMDLETGSQPNLEFLGLISAAAMLSAFGLLQNSAAVIIGAMLIAPLMTPILGAGMSLAHGNRPLFKASLITITIGFFGAIAASAAFGLLVRLVRPTDVSLAWVTDEMWMRCQPSPLDFCVGLVGGLAASYARTRSHLSSALAGAAIAAALVPPLATAGLQLSFGLIGRPDHDPDHQSSIMVFGPILLVTINVLTIMIGSSFMLWLRGMRGGRKENRREKWTVRMVMLIVLLTTLVMALSLHPRIVFPG